MAWGRVKLKYDILADIDRQIQTAQKKFNKADDLAAHQQAAAMKQILEDLIRPLESDINILKKRKDQL